MTTYLTKWDCLTEEERASLDATPCNLTCACGLLLVTEGDFAKHFFIEDRRYLNLGWCPIKDAARLERLPVGSIHRLPVEVLPKAQPVITTADGHSVTTGDRVFDYYDCYWVTLGRIDSEGWADTTKDDGTRGGILNGERISKFAPSWYKGK